MKKILKLLVCMLMAFAMLVPTSTKVNAVQYEFKNRGGTGSGEYEPGTEIVVTAQDAPTGKVFDCWEILDGEAEFDLYANPVTITMPAGDLIIYPKFKNAPENIVSVESGYVDNGDAWFTQGEQVILSAENPVPGEVFDRWELLEGSIGEVDLTANPLTFTMPGSYVSIRATYKTAVKYYLTVHDGDGTDEYLPGEQVTIQATTYEGYEFDKWTVIYGDVDFDLTANPVTFTMPEEDIELRATFKEVVKYPVVVQYGEGSGEYAEGEQVTITAAVPSGEVFTRWEVISGTGAQINTTQNPTTFTMPGEIVKVVAWFQRAPEPTKYTVTVTNGTGSGQYAPGETVTITANDRSGQGLAFLQWAVNAGGVTLGSTTTSTTTFTMPERNVEVAAQYGTSGTGGATTYQVNVRDAYETGGTFEGVGKYAPGSTVTIKPIAPEGKVFFKWQASGITLENDRVNPLTFTMPSTSVTLYAYFITAYNLVITDGQSFETVGQYHSNQDVTITAPVVPGKEFDKWVVWEDSVRLTDDTANPLTFKMPSNHVTIQPTYKGGSIPTQEYRVMIYDGQSSETVGEYEAGESVTITAPTVAGKEFDKWVAWEDCLDLDDETANPLTFTMPANHVMLEPKYKDAGSTPAPLPPVGGPSINNKVDVEASETEDGKKLDVDVVKPDPTVKEKVDDDDIIATIKTEETDGEKTISVKTRKKNKTIYVIQSNEDKLELVAVTTSNDKGIAEFKTTSNEKLTLTTGLPEGFIDTVEKETIYINKDNGMHRGWIELEEKWFFFDYATGYQKKEGWLPEAVDWYFFKGEVMVKNEWIAKDETGSVWYYVKEDGRFVRDTWIDGYYLDANGEWHA